jgi:iron complex outermembrane receptor protein
MGYRFPSIAEKFTLTQVGGVNIFPGPRLSSESGWNAEAGIKQGLKIAGWNGYVDLAAFYTEYHNMMEFVFGFYDTLSYLPTIEYFTFRNMGFQSQNIGIARIHGMEASLAGQGNLGRVPVSMLVGYTYSMPVDLNGDSAYRAGKADTNSFLKYRNIHSFKADIQLEYRRFQAGWSAVYTSFMLNVDAVFVDPFLGEMILPGYRSYRQKNREGQWVHDFRVSFSPGIHSRISLIVQNAFNKEYMGRPGDIRPPRSLLLQYNLRF